MKTLRAHGFNQRPRFEQVGYLERNEPLPLDQPDRKATSFVTSHFYLDDFVQSSEDPNPRPLQHTPLQAIREEGFRTPAEATDEDVRLARRYQGYGGTRFVEDDLAGDPEAGALASNGQGPPSITDRLRSTADGAQTAADLIGAGAAGLAAAQAFRSQLPQDAAEYVRLNVLPRPGPAQPPPQIIGRPSDVERLLDEAGQRAQEVERGAAQAVEETAAVAAEEGEVAVAAEGVGGAFGYLGGWRKGPLPWRPPRARLLERWLARRELARRQRRGWPLGLQAAQPTAWRAARAGCWRTRSSGPSRAAFCLDALIFHSSALSRSGLQFCPPQCARAKISEPNGCRSGIATFTFQCGVSVSLPFPSDPVGPPSVRPFAHSICFLLRLRAEAARHSKPVPDSVSANAPAKALQGINLCHGLSLHV